MKLAALRIADREGSWLELRDVGLSIDGAALLRGELAIRQLRAASAQVTRQPVAEPTAKPTSSSLDLAVPRLPLDVVIEDLGIDKVTLAPAVLGEPVSLDFHGRGRLTKGRIETHLALRRTDDKPGDATLDLSLDGQPAVLDLKGEINDPRGIIAAGFLQRADRPAMTTHFVGHGPLTDWHGHLDARLGSLLEIQSSIDIAGQGQTYRLTIQAAAHQDGLLPPDMAPLIGDRLALTAVMIYDGKAVVTFDKLTSLRRPRGDLRIRPSGQHDRARRRSAPSDTSGYSPGRRVAGRAPGRPARPRGHHWRDSCRANGRSRSARRRASICRISRSTGLTAQLQLALAEKQGQRQWKAQGKGRLTGLARSDAPLPATLDRDFDWSLSGSFDEADLSLQIRGSRGSRAHR